MVISVIGGKWKQEVVPKVSPSLLLLFLWGGGWSGLLTYFPESTLSRDHRQETGCSTAHAATLRESAEALW